ncbi:hypothetical protein FHR71_002479 [Methylobacterium sp. RAS18]|nr:hypothetical protein [Methylobacterium sp. RAS18]
MDQDSLDLVLVHLVGAPVIGLRGPGRGAIGDGGGTLQRAAFLEVGGYAGRPERVVADPGGNVGRLGSPLHHRVGVGGGEGGPGQFGRPAPDRPKQRPVAVPGNAGPIQIGVQVVRAIGVTEVTYYRWRKEYGGLKSDQVRRMKDLEVENQRLRKAIADLTLDKLILQEAARGN